MHASVRQYRVRDIDALVEKVEDEFVEQIKEIDGFVGYYVIDGETAEAVAESTRRAGNWVRESASELVEGEPEVTAGEVRVRAERPD